MKNFIYDNLIRKDGKLNNWWKKYLPDNKIEQLMLLTQNCSGSIPERIYWVLNDLSYYPSCPICGNYIIDYIPEKGSYPEGCTKKCRQILGGKKVSNNLVSKKQSEWDLITSKRKKTNLEKYGDENYTNIEKNKKTKLEKYGDENYNNRKLSEETCVKNNGYSHWFKSKEGKEFIISNNKNRNYTMSLDTHIKWCKSCKTKKIFKFPSGKEVLVQGYEPQVIQLLLEKYQESQIIVEHNTKPKIKYEFDNKIKNYFCDIYIPDENLIIEVKSTYTFELHYEKNIAKKNKCLELGYNFLFYIIDGKKKLFII